MMLTAFDKGMDVGNSRRRRMGKVSVKAGGVEYLKGTAGSTIMACSKCGEEHFREATDVFREHEGLTPCTENCFTCHTQMEPIRMDELKNRWYPFWRSLGWEVYPDGKPGDSRPKPNMGENQ